ncbi:MAG: SPOR domain-containing protein [Mariprofundaceae bacterium]|nr:SPOR domain-containing protein [Mariprofundaceae bacterium]
MRTPWLQTYAANTTEIKLAGMLALLASLIILVVSIIWFIPSSAEHETATPTMPTEVATIEKPSFSQPVIATVSPYNNILNGYSAAQQQIPSSSINPYATNITQAIAPAQKTAVQPKRKVTPAPAKASALKITVGKGHLYIQVGAFQKKALANIMYKKMQQHYKRAKVVDKGGIYAVWVGPVASKAQALALKKRILRVDKLTGFTVSEEASPL